MYIIQEYLGSGCWSDKYRNSDYQFIIDMFKNFQDKYPKSEFRLIEVFIYVWVMWAISYSRN